MVYFSFDRSYEHNEEYKSKEKTPVESKNTLKDWIKGIPLILFVIFGLIVCLIEKIFTFNKKLPDDVDKVKTWYLEFDDEEDHCAVREVGVDENGKVVVLAPYEKNGSLEYMGFWCDEDDDIDFFENIIGVKHITKEEFEAVWNSFEEPV